MNITEKILIDNLDAYTRMGFVSVIDGKDVHWAYAYHDGDRHYFTESETRACYIGFSRDGMNWDYFDAFHTRDPRREKVIAARKEAETEWD